MKEKLFLSLFVTIVVACTKNPAYYQSIGFDQTYAIVGRKPLSRPLTNRGFYTIWYDNQKRPLHITYTITNTLHPDPVFGVEQIRFEYSPTNEKRIFLDQSNQLKSSPEQKYAVAILTYNDRGQAIQVHYYDTQFMPTKDLRGAFYYQWVRDDQNRILRATGYDTNHQVVPYMGIGSVEFIYDKKGNLIEQRYYNAQLTLSSKNFFGYAIEKNTYDSHNRLIEKTFHDEKGNPVNYNFWHIHKYTYLYDKKGRLTNTLRYKVETNQEIVLITR